jgi:glycosyltransferase involved in cell wall biosynthesis
VADQLGCERVVYHCVDEYSAFAGAGADIARLEEELIRRSDLVITCSTPLEASKRLINPNTVLVRHGVERDHFARALDATTVVPDDVAQLPRPILGFYGLIAEWVDLAAFRACAEAFPEGSIVIVGPENNADAAGLERLRALPNVHLLGRKPYQALPGYCKAFDVALLPFIKNELTENANPLKLREYLAAGLPVVSTDIPEAVALADKGVYLARDSSEFVDGVKRALADGAGPSRARSEAMSGESWDAKVAEIETKLLRL